MAKTGEGKPQGAGAKDSAQSAGSNAAADMSQARTPVRMALAGINSNALAAAEALLVERPDPGKFAVYAMIALLATAPALIALQLARRRDETIAVQRFLMFMLALACGSGATDTIAGIVKPLVDSGRGSLILMEMTGELMVTSFAVWLFADLLAMGDRVRNIIPEVRPLSFHPPADRNARLLDCRSDPG